MICATRSASATATAARSPWTSIGGPVPLRRRPELARRPARASSPRSTGSALNSSASASSFERSRRSAVSLVSRSTCSRIVRTNSARAAGSGSSSSSSSTKPPSEKIGVRSSCEALAMNSWRWSAGEPLCISSSVAASWPTSSCPRPGSGSRSRPRRPLGRRLQPPSASRASRGDPAAAAPRQGDRPAIRIWRLTRATCRPRRRAASTGPRPNAVSQREGTAASPLRWSAILTTRSPAARRRRAAAESEGRSARTRGRPRTALGPGPRQPQHVTRRQFAATHDEAAKLAPDGPRAAISEGPCSTRPARAAQLLAVRLERSWGRRRGRRTRSPRR